MSRDVWRLPDGHNRLEKAMSAFWHKEEVPFPWSFNLYLYCCNGAGAHSHGNETETRKMWMRERHGEAAESLRAATRMALQRAEATEHMN